MTDRRVKPADPFLVKYEHWELKIASEFLSIWLPFLSRDLCHGCTDILADRIRSFELEFEGDSETSEQDENLNALTSDNLELLEESNDNHFDASSVGSGKDVVDTNSLGSWKDAENGSSEYGLEASTSQMVSESPSMETPSPRMSWADMTQEDELQEGEGEEDISHYRKIKEKYPRFAARYFVAG